MTSPDGITWTLRATPNIVVSWNAMNYSPTLNRIIACGNNAIMTSTDGTTWTVDNGSAFNGHVWRGVDWMDDKFFVFTQNRIVSSLDGLSWLLVPSPANNLWYDGAYSPSLGLYVMIAQNGVSNSVYTSTNGVNFGAIPSQPDLDLWDSIIWADNQFVMVAAGTSSDTGLSLIHI